MKLFLTGGHPAPAIAFIDYVKSNYKEISMVFVGKRYNNENEKTDSFEYKEVLKYEIKFLDLKTGRFIRDFSIRSIIMLYSFFVGIFSSCIIIHREKPNAIITFGGYIGLTVAIAGFIMRLPVYIHDQPIYPGLATRIIAFFAKEVFLSFPESATFFKRKTIVSGNLIRKSIFEIKEKVFEIPNNATLLYITGGSLGSHGINTHISKILKNLLTEFKDFYIVHQTGNIQEYNDYEKARLDNLNLPIELQNRYLVKEHISSDEIGFLYNRSDIVISRCGANTFFELLFLKKPAIVIPLPNSANGEQNAHAKLLEKFGVAEYFDQKDMSENLLKKIKKVSKNIDTMKANYTKLDYFCKKNAEETIFSHII